MLYLVDRSRTGRGWRALRDDPLAAEIMTVPIRRLKLMAFATGAAVAGLAGSLFASFQLGVYPLNFQIQFLIVDLRGADPRRQRQPRGRGRRRSRRDARARLAARPEPGERGVLRRDRRHANREGAPVENARGGRRRDRRPRLRRPRRCRRDLARRSRGRSAGNRRVRLGDRVLARTPARIRRRAETGRSARSWSASLRSRACRGGRERSSSSRFSTLHRSSGRTDSWRSPASRASCSSAPCSS